MATTKVYAPNAGYTGRVGDVAFADGLAEVDADTQGAALAYFRGRGYGIGEPAAPGPEATPAPAGVDVRTLTELHLGAPARDAAVDPRPADFLPPTNAGMADPHGPLVVSPGIHGVAPTTLVQGPVSSDAAAQQYAETPVVAGSRPASSANKAEWVAYAVSQGMSQEEAEDTTKADLQGRFGDEG